MYGSCICYVYCCELFGVISVLCIHSPAKLHWVLQGGTWQWVIMDHPHGGFGFSAAQLGSAMAFTGVLIVDGRQRVETILTSSKKSNDTPDGQ